ncbi:unnamed protein product [Rotaria sp. Silwood1]|nr:unnamed protein product [Rotaria sp. Silwood1]CAF1643239.1 unnamed protein product [Rotaria sp. Silwood1]
MTLCFDGKRKLSFRSDRVKCVDIHSNELWILATLYNGHAHIYNYDTQQLIKTFEICDVPVRTDDMTIKLWDWDAQWALKQTFEGHTHYVMQIAINPKDDNSFASASLDRTVKVWQLESTQPTFTLEGHEKGVNCVNYCSDCDKPYVVSGGDDHLVKIWDYQNQVCVKTLEGHSQNVGCVAFHPELPIILSGSEDGTVKLWRSDSYCLESTLNFGLGRCWTISCLKGSNNVAVGYDEGTLMIKDKGTIDWFVSQDVADPTKFAIVERYEQQSDLQTHINNPYYKLFGAYVKPLLSKPLELHSVEELDTSKEVEVPPQTWSDEADN